MSLPFGVGGCVALRWLCMAWAVFALQVAWSQPVGASQTAAHAHCDVRLIDAWAAKEHVVNQRPDSGWERIAIPDTWKDRWPDWNGTTWYRMDWYLPCPEQHHALSISAIRTAGTVYWGDELLWSDRYTAEPLSRSANVPRWWPLSTQGRAQEQTVWVRVAGSLATPGLGRVDIGPAHAIRDTIENSIFHQRLGYTLTAAMSAAIGCVAFFVWLWRRSESGYLWFGLMQLMWTAYLTLLLKSEPVPGLTTTAQSIAQMLSFLFYTQCFLIFSLRFVGLKLPKLELLVWLAAVGWIFILVLYHVLGVDLPFVWLFRWGSLLVHGSCLLVIGRAIYTRQARHVWLALFWAGILVVASHDIVVAMQVWDYDKTWSAIFSPVTTIFLAGMLGWQLASRMRRVDLFNLELQQRVDEARQELAQALEKQHAQELEHAKLQERVHLAHDLHDGLGGSLVRSLALVEQAAPELQKERVLSMLKVLRDDLRQVIDCGSSRDVMVPETPALWLAPLRHRFMLILDELRLQASWQVDAQWSHAPGALQCMTMSRFLEEAFANVIKHSRAKHLKFACTQPDQHLWRVSLEDDGVGFDVAAVKSAGMGIGMHSMQTRVSRMGGTLTVSSSAAGTLLIAEIALTAP